MRQNHAMRNDVVHLISHLGPENVNDTLQGAGFGADHIVGATAFTANARHDNGEEYATHRFALLLVADPQTAHDMQMHNEIGAHVVEGLLERFRDLLHGVFGEEVVALAVMQGLATMLGVDDDDDEPENNHVLN